MRVLNRIWSFFRSLAHRGEVDRELDAEVRAHAEMLADEKVQQGMSAQQAQRAARLEMGGIEQVKEEVRSARPGVWLETLWQDVRFSARMLRKNPAFTAVAVLTLALGIGANTAIFSLVDVVLFRPLPIAKPSEVVRFTTGSTRGESRFAWLSFPAYEEYRDNTDAFSGIVAYLDRLPVNFSAAGAGAERVDAGMVTGNYFQVLGINPMLGRVILPDDDRAGAAPVVMLSYGYWRRSFAADRGAIGRQVIIDGAPFTIVGVTPPGFEGVSFENYPGVWLPMSYGFQIDPLLHSQIPLGRESFQSFAVVARLRPGVSAQQAQAQVETVAERYGAGQPAPVERTYVRLWPVLVPALEEAQQSGSRLSRLLMGIVLIVLLIACADGAGLLLARAENRQKEIALRLALGATRNRTIRLHLIEALVVAALGTAAGGLLAYCGVKLLTAEAPPTLPIPIDRAVSILDLRVLAFTSLVGILAGLASGIAPAWRHSRSDLGLSLKGTARTGSTTLFRLPLRSALVILQVGACVPLLIGAGLLARTLAQAARIPLGFDSDHLAFASTDPMRQGYSKAAAASLLEPLLDALRAQPGVQSAALGSATPLQGGPGTVIVPEGREANGGKADWVQLVMASPGYFDTVGIPMLGGRDFALSDGESAPRAAIVNAFAAQEYWPGQNPIGKHIEDVGPKNQTFEVVGVVGNTAPGELGAAPFPVVYVPFEQAYLMFPFQPDVDLLARGSGESSGLLPAIRAAVARMNPNLPVFRAHTMREQVAMVLGEQNFLARALMLFSVLATILSATGIYGLLSYTTANSTQELGIRLALGAQPRSVLWMVIRKGMALMVVGLVIGLTAAVGLTHLVAAYLYGVRPTDLFTFAAVALLIFVVTLAACYFPARTATKVDPIVALRYE
ncbi:MAG: ABC transporter permease [Candidatus Acidiferrales bacterium]